MKKRAFDVIDSDLEKVRLSVLRRIAERLRQGGVIVSAKDGKVIARSIKKKRTVLKRYGTKAPILGWRIRRGKTVHLHVQQDDAGRGALANI